MSKYLFGSVMLAGVLSSSIDLAHVSHPGGPVQADKSGSNISFGLPCDLLPPGSTLAGVP